MKKAGNEQKHQAGDLARLSREFLAGPVSAALTGYETRPSQIAFMDACAAAVESGGMLLAEAGTGTGKTFGYLIPIMLSGKRAVVSTKTKTLQEQLFSKDLSFLAGIHEFRFALLKGRGNYLCLRRLSALDMVEKDDLADLQRALLWAGETRSGDLDELPLEGKALRPKICSDADACARADCGFYGSCFYFTARRRSEKARCVVVNHALLAVNAMLPDDAKVIADADLLVVDEAHALDMILTEKSGAAVSSAALGNLLSLLGKRVERGGRKGRRAPKAVPAEIGLVRAQSDLFWEQARVRCPEKARVRGPFALKEEAERLSSSIRDLVILCAAPKNQDLFTEDDRVEVNGIVQKLLAAASALRGFCEDSEGCVRWVETGKNDVVLRIAPVNPRKVFNEGVMPLFETAVLTSATLSERGDFAFIEALLGVEGAARISVPSAFDLRRQVRLRVKGGIDPASEDTPRRLSGVILEEAGERDGGILVLFTSRGMMHATWQFCKEKLSALGLAPMVQGSLPRAEMLEAMREGGNGVLFGLDSFWEGIDVKGDALKCVIITKLPFDVPTEPVTEARLEEIRKRDGNPFAEYSLPRAVLKFRQGVGRLIRSATDTGRVVICDERIVKMPYGRRFLESLR